jgi:hypothetical protein
MRKLIILIILSLPISSFSQTTGKTGTTSTTTTTTVVPVLNNTIYKSLLGQIKDLEKGSNDTLSGEVYTAKDEFEYKAFACSEFYKNRKAEYFNFVRTSPAFDKDKARENIAVFNVFYQMARSGNFPKETCFDYEIDSVDKNKFKMSFGFQRSYLEADSTAQMDETAKIGYILNSFKRFSANVTNPKIANVKPVTNVYIHGFADQEPYGAKTEMKYLDSKGVEKTSYYYKSDGAKGTGLYDLILKSKDLVSTDNSKKFPIIGELTRLETKLADRHDKFPTTETTDINIQKSYEKYISDVEVNEFLALNRAIQTKRALKLYMSNADAFGTDLQVGPNASSSCRNMIVKNSNYKTDNELLPNLANVGANCAKRRTTVVEASAATYFHIESQLAANATVKGPTWSPGAHFYANCAYNKDESNYNNTTLFDFLLNGKKGITNKVSGIKFESGSEDSHNRLISGDFSIYDVLKEAHPTITPEEVKGKFVLRQNIFPFSNLDYTLTIEQIAKILSQPLFRFYTYPHGTMTGFEKKASGPWKFDMTSEWLTNFISKDEQLNFDYFRYTHMYLDVGCKFTNEYIPLARAGKPIPYESILAILKTKPIQYTGQVYAGADGKGLSKSDCLVLPNSLYMTANCKLTQSKPGSVGLTEADKGNYKFPVFGFDKTMPAEGSALPENDEILIDYLKYFDNTVTSTNLDTKIKEAVDKVNSMFCSTKDQTKGGYFKPTIDEQADCKK